MRNKKVESAIKGLESLSPSETDILIALEYIEKLEKQDEKDFTLIYLKGCADKDGVWRDKIQAKLNKQYDLYNSKRQKEYSQEVIDCLEELLEGE